MTESVNIALRHRQDADDLRFLVLRHRQSTAISYTDGRQPAVFFLPLFLYSCTKLYCCNRGTNTSTSFGRSLRNCVRQGIESPSLDCEHGVVFSYHTTPHIHCPEKTEGCKISFSSVGRGASCRQSLGPIVLFVCWFVCFNTVACRQVVLFRYQVKTP